MSWVEGTKTFMDCLICKIMLLFSAMAPKKESKPHKPRNYMLGGSGVSRFSQSRMFQKRGVFKLKNKKFNKAGDKKKDARMVTKQIGGEKNGGTRTVRINRMVSNCNFTCHQVLKLITS